MTRSNPEIPTGFAEEIDRLFGAAGHPWLRRLPALLGDALLRWSLVRDGISLATARMAW